MIAQVAFNQFDAGVKTGNTLLYANEDGFYFVTFFFFETP